jgi:hypothetical protein
MIPVIWATILLSCFGPSDNIFNDFTTDGIDTIAIGGYQGYVYYRYENKHKINFNIRIVNDTASVLERGAFEVGLYNFCQDSINAADTCYLKNIDDDSYPEMIIRCYGGGNHCCEDLIVISLQDSAIILDSLQTDYSPFGLIKDLDGDSIPEYVWSDPSWDWWKTFRSAFETGAGRYYPDLVWKWDGARYRIANYKFPGILLNEYIIHLRNKLEISEIPDSLKKGYDPSDSTPMFPPPELVNIMVAYHYAGDIAQADSIFDNFWPDNIPGKTAFYSDLKEYLISTPYWDQIKDSNWRITR